MQSQHDPLTASEPAQPDDLPLTPAEGGSVENRRLDMLYGGLGSSLLANIAAGGALVGLMWPHVEHRDLLAWLGLLAVVTALRAATAGARAAATDRYRSVWLTVFRAGALISALVWASTTLLTTIPHETHEHLGYYALVLVGVSVGGATALAVDRPLVHLFLAITVLPAAARFALESHHAELLMSALIVVYYVLISMNADRIHRSLLESMRLHQASVRQREALAESEARYRGMIDHMVDGLVTLDGELLIREVNPAFERMFGYAPDALYGEPLSSLVAPERRDDCRQHCHRIMEGRTGAKVSPVLELEGLRVNGSRFPLELSASIQQEHGRPLLTAVVRDISERRKAEERIEWLAFFDELTGLPNRRLLITRLEQALAAARRHGDYGALLFFDLDNFKRINEALGHPAGDVILRQVARRLNEQVRADDTVARLGGDEFVVLLTRAGDNKQLVVNDAQQVADKLRDVLNAPYPLGGQHYHFTSSIGVVVFPDAEQTADDLLKQADTAMYQSKDAGRDTVRFYAPSMQLAADSRLALEKELRLALDRDELSVYFQPQIQIEDQRIIGAEALLRWSHPKRGMVSPGEFIPVAEESGLIAPIGDWVLERTAAHLLDMQQMGLGGVLPEVAVNVSPRQFHGKGFVERVARLLDRSGLDPLCLKLEITEGAVMGDVEEAIKTMRDLRALGLRFSVDDFGTGYSSLAYLKRLPLDQLKIDRSFVNDISHDRSDATIVETIISMARLMGLDVIAEGVETEQQLDFLRDRGCLAYQGYLFSPPVPVEDLKRMLIDDRAAQGHAAG